MSLPAIPLLSKGFAFLRDPKILILLIVIGVVAYSAKATVDNIQEASFNAGVASERQVWEKKREEEIAAYNEEVRRLTELVISTQVELSSKLAKLEEDSQKKLKGVIDEKDAIITKLRSGNLRLSIELRDAAAEAATTELAGATAVRHATYRAELSRASSEFLITFAADADIAATALGTCQETIRLYRRTVEEYNQKYLSYSF